MIRERTPLQWATDYLNNGWMCVPTPHRTKHPVIDEWEDIRLDTIEKLSRHFNNGNRINISVLTGAPSHNLHDVDLDFKECLPFARGLLPETRQFGRPGNPVSHWLYTVDDMPKNIMKFQVDFAGREHLRADGEDKGMVLEIRGTRHQTVFPGSIHPTGEQILWRGQQPIVKIAYPELYRLCARIASLAVLARCWPRVSGKRHECALALAGFFIRCGWSNDEIKWAIGTIATIAGNDVEIRTNVVEPTRAKFDAGEKVTGWKHLTELLDAGKVIEKIPDWLGYDSHAESQTTSTNASTVDPGEENFEEAADEDLKPDPINKAALYGVAGDIVNMIEPHTEADPVALLIQVLAAFGNAAGRNAYYQVETTRHYANVYVVLVGETAEGRKGTAKDHVMSVFRLADEDWTLNRVQSGLSSGEGVIWAVRDPVTKQEPIKEKGRVTGYQTVVVDDGVEDKRLLILESEFASALRVMGRDGSTLSAVLRNGWDNGLLRILTKNQSAKATDALISIIGHITSEELLRYLDSTEAANGFANRFLWLYVRRSKCLPEGGHLDQVNFKPAMDRLQKAILYAGKPQRIHLNDEAREIWHSIYPDLSKGQPGMFGAVTARAAAQTVRLALIYALLDSSSHIGKAHMLAAIALWDYCQDTAASIFGDSLGDPDADEMLAALRRNVETGLSRTELSNLFGRHRTAQQIGKGLALLQKRGKARRETVETSGRPVEMWFATTKSRGTLISHYSLVSQRTLNNVAIDDDPF